MINLISIFPITKISVNDNVIDKDNNENSENLFQPIYSGLDVNKFDHYKIITINHNKVEGTSTHTNFPILISLLDKDLHDKTQQPDGDDIAFSNGTIWLDHEIELFDKNYNETHAKLVAWVRIPALSTSTDTIIYMYYGNSTMESQQNPSGVWSSDYSGVWHLNETDGGPNAIKDSTNNANHGTDASNPELGIDGKIGGATDFDGYDTDQEITIAASESLNPTYITVSAWIYPRGQTEPFGDPETGMFVSDYDWTYENSRIWLFYMHPNDRVYAQVYWTEWVPGEDNYTLVCSDIISLFEWHFVHFTVNSTTLVLYVDGSNAGELATASHTGGIVQYLNTLEIGSEEQMTGYHEYNGIVDECRISNGARSAGWIATEYNNQHDPNSFYSIGEENDITIIIESPVPNQLNGLNAPEYDLTIADANLDSIWYTLDEGETNSTPSTQTTGTINQTLWDARPNGTVTIRFYANNTFGNINYEEVTVRKDIILPFADITDPYPDGDKIGDTVISISGTANGTGSNIVSMYINDSRWGIDQKPQTDPSGSSTGEFIFNNNTNIAPEFYWVEINITDAAGNVNISLRFFEVTDDDISPPIITINSPDPDEVSGSNAPDYDLTITDANFESIWYSLDGGTTNSTPSSATIGTINQTLWDAKENGTVTIRFFANDTLGNMDYKEVMIMKDIDPPNIIIITPVPDQLNGSISPDYSLIVLEGNLDSIWYTLDGGKTNSTPFTEFTDKINQAMWDARPDGSVIIRFYINDTLGNMNHTDVTILKETEPSLTPSDGGGGGGGSGSSSSGDSDIFPIILIIVIGTVVSLIGIIIFIKKKVKKAPREKALGTIESIVD
jgi:hypothetical protein